MNATATPNEKRPIPAAVPYEAGNHYVAPEVNVYETTEGYAVQAELPGVSKDGLDITVEGNTLTILGRRSRSDLQAEPLYRESNAADYRRVFELDPAIDAGRIDAKIEQGILTILLPKSEQAKPRKIAVSE